MSRTTTIVGAVTVAVCSAGIATAITYGVTAPDPTEQVWSGATTGDLEKVPGVCTFFINDFDNTRYAISCVPQRGWAGGELQMSWEDGSAMYTDTTTFDPETMTYQPGW